MLDPPPLPRRLDRIGRVVAVGTGLWTLGAVALLLGHLLVGRPLDVWFTTCVAGALLGAVGFGIVRWQRAAVRRGSRTAPLGLE